MGIKQDIKDFFEGKKKLRIDLPTFEKVKNLEESERNGFIMCFGITVVMGFLFFISWNYSYSMAIYSEECMQMCFAVNGSFTGDLVEFNVCECSTVYDKWLYISQNGSIFYSDFKINSTDFSLFDLGED